MLPIKDENQMLSDEIRHVFVKRAEKAELDDQLKRCKAELAEMEMRLVEKFAMEGISNVKVDGSTVSRRIEKHYSISPGHRAAVTEWARANGLDEMIAVNSRSFGSWCRHEVEECGELPEDLRDKVQCYEKLSLRVLKS